MKQAVMTAPGKIEIHEIEVPTPGEGEVLHLYRHDFEIREMHGSIFYRRPEGK